MTQGASSLDSDVVHSRHDTEDGAWQVLDQPDTSKATYEHSPINIGLMHFSRESEFPPTDSDRGRTLRIATGNSPKIKRGLKRLGNCLNRDLLD